MASNIPVIVQGNSFSLAIPLQIYYINGDQMDLQDYTPDPTDDVSVQLKGSRRNYTYTPTIDGNVANIDLSGNELADNYSVVVSIVKANGQRLRSFRTDQFFIVESSDDLTQDDIIAGLEENIIYLNAQAFIAGADGRGIEGIQKTGTSGLVDTYTITYTDNTTSTFTVTNGAAGEAGATIASVEKTATVGKVDTYTITMTDGNTFDFEVTNGLDGVDLGLANIVNDLTTGGEGSALSAEMGKVLNNKLYTPKSLASGSVAPNTVLFTMADLAGSTIVQYDFSATSGKAGFIELYKEGASKRYALIGKSSGSSGALDYSGTISIPNDFGRAVWKGTANGTFRTLSCSVLKDDQILATVDEVKDEILETASFTAGYYASEEILTVGLDIAVGDILNYDFSVASGEIGVIKFVASDGTLVSQIGKTSTSGSTLAFSGSVAIPANTAFVRVLNITINSLTYTKKRIYALEQYQAINNSKYVPFANKLVCDDDYINQVLTGLYITNKDIIADLDNITSIEIYGGTGASAAARPLVGIIFNGTTEIRCYYENDDASQLTKYMSHVFYCNGVFAVIDWTKLQKWSNIASLKYIERDVTLNTSVVTDVASNPIIEAYIGRTTINRDYKLISFAGDSITYGLKDEADGGGQWVAFPSLVGDALQIKTMNYGVPSATCMISSTQGQRSWCRDYTVIRDDSDIVAMMIGINDCYRGYTLGTMSDRTTDTFYGALHVMWQGLINRFPPKNNKRLFMIDYFEIDEEPIATTTWSSFVQAQREVAEYYSIPICYLSKELGITPQLDTGYEYWGEWEPVGTHSPHPKQPTHDAIARVVASWIKAHLG